MPTKKLIRHGTNDGYRAEITIGDACPRCKIAHNKYQTQYSKAAKRSGIKYSGSQVLDGSGTGTVPGRAAPSHSTAEPQPVADYTVGTVPSAPDPTEAPHGPSLADRVRGLVIGGPDEGYVNEEGIPSYITVGTIEPDPDPAGDEYQQIPTDSPEFIINAAGMAKIEDSLGTYLSIFGITMEMIDPYCGPVLAENMDNIVKHWSKVIAKYPKAAELFMDGKGGTLMTWIGAIQATWPFLYAMYEHHFSKDVQVSGGQIIRKGRGPFRGEWPQDSTTPPMPETFQYSAG